MTTPWTCRRRVRWVSELGVGPAGGTVSGEGSRGTDVLIVTGVGAGVQVPRAKDVWLVVLISTTAVLGRGRVEGEEGIGSTRTACLWVSTRLRSPARSLEARLTAQASVLVEVPNAVAPVGYES